MADDSGFGKGGGVGPTRPTGLLVGSNGEWLPPELAAQVRFFQEQCEREIAELRDFHREALQRFIDGYATYGHSWRNKDLDKETREERLDAFNYKLMKKMGERGL